MRDGDEIIDNPQNGVVYFGQRMLERNNKEVGIRFLVAYLKATRDLHGDGWLSAENIAAINKYTGMPEATIEKSITYYFDPNASINQASVERIQQYLVSRGYTEYTELIPVSEIIDLQYLDEALDIAGEY